MKKKLSSLIIIFALPFLFMRSISAAETQGIISQTDKATAERLAPAQSYSLSSPKEVDDQEFEWQTLSAPLPVARYGHVVVSENGKLYSIGGETAAPSAFYDPVSRRYFLEIGGVEKEFLEFDPEKNVWRKLPDLPMPQMLASGAVLDGKIYVFGSYGFSDIVQIYDIAKGVWSKGPSLPVPSYWHTAQAVGNKIYVIGGYASRQQERLDRAVYILDTETNMWRKGKDIPVAMQIPTSAAYGTDIYVFYDGKAYRYDTVADAWESIPMPPAPLGNSSAAVTYGNKIFLCGGNHGYIYEAFRGCAIYDIPSRKWAAGPSMKSGRYHFDATI
ncbi:MAG TPA: hypothetical protein VI728_12355, partial [Syntrophales bacterium]|nr:hypothetical protein [Syntrophales bacterium]